MADVDNGYEMHLELTESQIADKIWNDAVLDAMADGASRQDAEENADRLKREYLTDDMSDGSDRLPCMACECIWCDGSCII